MKILFLDKIFPELKKNLIREGLICIDNFVEKKEKIEQIIYKYDGIIIRSRFKIDKAVIDFPDPDSPTIPNISFLFSWNEISDKIILLSIFTVNFSNDRRILFFICHLEFSSIFRYSLK